MEQMRAIVLRRARKRDGSLRSNGIDSIGKVGRNERVRPLAADPPNDVRRIIYMVMNPT